MRNGARALGTRQLLARVGEHVCCTGGHEIAIVKRAITIDMEPTLDDFGSWNVDPPGAAGAVFAICRCSCGAPWARLNDFGDLELWIGGHWRGPAGEAAMDVPTWMWG